MAKSKPETTLGDPAAPKQRQRWKQSYLSRLFPFLGELKADADEKFKKARLDEATSDAEIEKRYELRKVLADFPVNG